MRSMKKQALILGSLLALMWLLEILDSYVLRPVFGLPLQQFGIVPRDINGLRGLLFAPFLHGSFVHLMSNSLPFLALGWLVMLRAGIRGFFAVSLLAMLLGGLGTWVIGSSGVHIGASGVIFGYLGYLLMAGFFDRRLFSMALSLLVAFLYGGLLWGVLPNQPGVSWEGHVCGFLSGTLAARLAAPQPRLRKA